MKRMIAICLIVCAMAVCFTACGRDTGTVSTTTDGTVNGGQTIVPEDPEIVTPEPEFEDPIDDFQQDDADFGNGMEDEMNDITQYRASSIPSPTDPQIRKRSSGTGMTGGR